MAHVRSAMPPKIFANDFTLCDMDLHLIVSVIQISARIPLWSCGLSTPQAVGGARQNRVISVLRLPVVTPHAPRIVRLFVAEFRQIPSRSTVLLGFDLPN